MRATREKTAVVRLFCIGNNVITKTLIWQEFFIYFLLLKEYYLFHLLRSAMKTSALDRINEDFALTFDHVMLEPALSYAAPAEVKLHTHFSSNVSLRAPVVLDNASVENAIHAAQLGGIGILSNDMPISKQSDFVRQVKRFQSRIVRDVMTVTPETSIIEALEYKQRYGIGVLPVTEAGTHVLGGFLIFDDAVDYDAEKTVSHYMSDQPAPTIPLGADLSEAYALNMPYVAVIDAQNRCVGLITREDKNKFDQFPHATMDENGSLCVAAMVGTGDKELDRANALIDAGVDVIVVRNDHGHSKAVLDMVTYIRRQRTGHVDVIAGNICTAQGALALIDAGANGVIVGSCCDYAAVGVGLPQLAAIMQVAESCAIQNIPLIAAYEASGANMAKAFAAGAHAMLVDTLDTHQDMLNQLKTAISYTGCTTLREFNTRARFVRVGK